MTTYNPEVFKAIFINCGWDVKGNKAYYKSKTGSELYQLIKDGFNVNTKGKRVKCIPIEPLIKATLNMDFQRKQVEDFITKLQFVLSLKTSHYYALGKYCKSKLGMATLLDHRINRPNHVITYFNDALKTFFKNNSKISKNPNDWGKQHTNYERQLLDIYGPLREAILGKMQGMTDGVKRYKAMKLRAANYE